MAMCPAEEQRLVLLVPLGGTDLAPLAVPSARQGSIVEWPTIPVQTAHQEPPVPPAQVVVAAALLVPTLIRAPSVKIVSRVSILALVLIPVPLPPPGTILVSRVLLTTPAQSANIHMLAPEAAPGVLQGATPPAQPRHRAAHALLASTILTATGRTAASAAMHAEQAPIPALGRPPAGTALQEITAPLLTDAPTLVRLAAILVQEPFHALSVALESTSRPLRRPPVSIVPQAMHVVLMVHAPACLARKDIIHLPPALKRVLSV